MSTSSSTHAIVNLDAPTNEGAPSENEGSPRNNELVLNDKVVGEENVEHSEYVIQKAKRKKTSSVWEHFKEVNLKSGTKTWECLHCHKNYAMISSGSTSHLIRHLGDCLIYKKLITSQKKLNLQPAKSMVDAKLYGPLLVNPNVKYDHARQREAIAHWIMMHEHPFNIVEEEGFIFMMKCCNISYEKISRKTVKNDCVTIYESEKKKLKSALRDVSKICLTTDFWKSQNQKIEYMVLTGHFIDADWILQKRILSFVHVPPPRRGVDIADAIFKCLKDWGIESKVFSVSVDNAAYNDRCLKELKVLLSRHVKLVLDGKLFHVRCCAHILNLRVQDGLGRIVTIIEKIRESVKFINYSEARLRTFSQVVQQLKLGGKKLVLDCLTRWNSTYDMLSIAIQFKEVFPRFQDREPSYTSLPEADEWEKVEKVAKLL
ncbi:PREDICTED: zinc finger BED domain-containing protein RICESLEEPER 2-like [Lupinus angustifolius]|uniref:zinc finger BED domain-containing protein RICESLEEPER 2-like n=1 Tax=Lupinus angustifolius TaxID=3871 RepID=UPI00092ECDBE|nr:PREDICTED: zinc finger BED domain-containing protein RICESLEEPER 2-like [Lupinus angustifolius]